MKKLKRTSVYFGCDPEFFFTQKGKVVGAEKILKKEGIDVSNSYSGGANRGKVIIDGVQAELNPAPSTCRQSLSVEIGNCFKSIKNTVDKDTDIDFSKTIELPQQDFDKLSDDSKKFGCAPSKNAYQKNSKIKVDPKKEKTRSTGGHLHFGRSGALSIKALDDPKRLIPVLDALLGNTCVLLDRDEGNVERRKTYGKAGEYRTPQHGLEYRTLSNFWLQNYQLMSLVFGLGRMAIEIVGSDLDKSFMKNVSRKDVKKAINTNDYDLAYENFLKIEPFLSELEVDDNHTPLSVKTIPLFKHFISKGMEYWFKEDGYNFWVDFEGYHGGGGNRGGWEYFLLNEVRNDMAKK